MAALGALGPLTSPRWPGGSAFSNVPVWTPVPGTVPYYGGQRRYAVTTQHTWRPPITPYDRTAQLSLTTRVDGINEVKPVYLLVRGNPMYRVTPTQPLLLRRAPTGIDVEFLAVGEGDRRTESWGPFQLTEGELFTLTDTLADGVVSVAYQSSVSLTGAESPISWWITGTLPPGLDFDDGEVFGTPTMAGTYRFSIGVQEARGGRTFVDCSVTITP